MTVFRVLRLYLLKILILTIAGTIVPFVILPPRILSANETSLSSESKATNLEEPRGPRPATAYTLLESNPELKQQIQSIPSAQIRGNLLASIGQAIKRTQPEGDIIAVGRIEMPEGARTLQDGTPQGGALFLQDGERKLNFAAPGGWTTNGSVYWGKDQVSTSHWPWYVTFLQSGKTNQVQCMTLQHKQSDIVASNENHCHGIVLPTAKLDALTKKDVITVSTKVTCNGDPFPAHASLGLPGFSNAALRLRIDADDGQLEVALPRDILSNNIPLAAQIENEYCFPQRVDVSKADLTQDSLKLAPVNLTLKKVIVLHAMVTNSDTFNPDERRSFELDAHAVDPSRSREFNIKQGYQLTASQSKLGATVSLTSMVKFADLGKELPKIAVAKPVPGWFDETKLQNGGKVLLKPDRYYLIKCENLVKNDALKWAMVRVDSPVSLIDNRVAKKANLGPNLRETMIRLGRFRTFFGFSGMTSKPGLNVNGSINDDDAKLISTIRGNVFIHLDNNHQLTRKGLRKIATSSNVALLRFRRMNVSANVFQEFKQLQVSELVFDNCSIQRGKNLINSRRLSSVTLNNCDVDPLVVSVFSGCTNLQRVTFKNCTGLTGNEQVFAQLPQSVSTVILKNCKVDPRLPTALQQQRGARVSVSISETP